MTGVECKEKSVPLVPAPGHCIVRKVEENVSAGGIAVLDGGDSLLGIPRFRLLAKSDVPFCEYGEEVVYPWEEGDLVLIHAPEYGISPAIPDGEGGELHIAHMRFIKANVVE